METKSIHMYKDYEVRVLQVKNVRVGGAETVVVVVGGAETVIGVVVGGAETVIGVVVVGGAVGGAVDSHSSGGWGSGMLESC